MVRLTNYLSPKEYILKEYHDIFKGVGTLPGGPYHIRLKEQYRPGPAPTQVCPSSNADCIKGKVR